MAIEVDAYDYTVAIVKVIETSTFPTAFDTTPIVICFSDTDKKKSGVDLGVRSSTAADVSCETLGMRIWLITAGYSAEVAGSHPEVDSGIEDVVGSKTFQSFTFNSTFSEAPMVIAGYEGATAGGKKISVKSITTTGGDISNENANEDTSWLAIVKGAFGI